MKTAVCIAHANIALAKYWGKADISSNMPAVPSLSMTLDQLATTTEVTFDSSLSQDELRLDGTPASASASSRASQLLDRVRAEAQCDLRARVVSTNNFPTASGLASSASGFAALALAARAALELPEDLNRSSALARQSSASAARSVYGGFVELPLGASAASPLKPRQPFDVRLLIAVTHGGAKPVGSTAAMEQTRQTSPYYGPWVDHAPRLYERIRSAVLSADLEALGPVVEQSALMMHASMMAADPGILYWNAATLNAIQTVREARSSGVRGYFTMDAGPHVKVITSSEHCEQLERLLTQTPGVRQVIHCRLGPRPELRVTNPGAQR